MSEWQWTYIEYPRTLHGANGATVTVQNDQEKDAKLADGYRLMPWTAEEPAPVVEPEPVAEVVADPEPKKRGRKKSDD